MEKAIEIKRRAQRCIQNGDLDGALSEYRKLTGSEDSDPYTFVLIADLHFKKGDGGEASQSYLAGVGAYEKAGLYKNAIAICKKMMRLSLSPPIVLQRLAQLHALDGLATEAALYYMQYAEHLTREQRFKDAAETLRAAYTACPDSINTLERLAEVQLLADDESAAVQTLLEASARYAAAGQEPSATRVRDRAEELSPGASRVVRDQGPPPPPTAAVDAVTPVTSDRFAGAPEPEPVSDLDPPVAPAPMPTVAGAAPRGGDIDAPGDWFTTNASEMGVTPVKPGLQFQAPAELADAAEPGAPSLASIEALLREAEDQFRAGDREAAGATLVRAAQAYDGIGKLDNAGAIYRSLGRSAHVTAEVMALWLKNCESRNDTTEASQVACALGEAALNEGDTARARTWFEHARHYDAGNDLAVRRLQRLDQGTPPASETTPAAASETNGRVEVALGRAQAVTLDLGSMIAEFQRGIETQLSGDPRSHYDLGVTYREMGLLEQAIESFRVAERDPAFIGRCAEMIGRSLLDQGQFDDAVTEFSRALAHPELPSDAELNLRYQLGLSYEAAGRTAEALAEFERVYGAQASYPEVAAKIRGLRRTPESV